MWLSLKAPPQVLRRRSDHCQSYVSCAPPVWEYSPESLDRESNMWALPNSEGKRAGKRPHLL